jgi:hypothetical protein
MNFANATEFYRESGVAEWSVCGFFPVFPQTL